MTQNIVTTNDALDLLEPIIESIHKNSEREPGDDDAMSYLFTETPSSKATETMVSLYDLPMTSEWEDNIPYVERYGQAYKTTVDTVVKFAMGVKFDFDSLQSIQYQAEVLNVIPELIRKAKMRIKQQKVSMIENGHNTSIFTGGDGVSLYSSAHPTPSGAFTQSNTGTTALSITSFKAAIQQMAKTKDYVGDTLGLIMDAIVVPVDLYYTALEIVKTVYQVNSANNNINPVNGATALNGIFDVILCREFTDTNNWYLFSRKLAKKDLVYFIKTPIKGITASDFDTQGIKHAVLHTGNVGSRHWANSFGSNVS